MSDLFLPGSLNQSVTQHQQENVLEAVAEIARRKIESLRLYEPTPFQDEFHRSTAKEACIMAGNQVGKTVCSMAEVARAVCGCDPYDKYPKENGVAVILGLDEKHIGRTIHDYLFKTARFKIVRDKKTNEWRAWRPWKDTEYKPEEILNSPPFIPERMVKKIAWAQRGLNIFSRVEFHNGWILYAMSSKGEPAGGFQADLVCIDEDIERPEWYGELLARTTMRDGRLIWSALPLNKNDAMCSLVERAEEEKEKKTPNTVVFRATMFDNIYMPPKAREENIRILRSQGEDEYRKRVLGEMVIDSILMYPTFSKDVHSAVPRKLEDARSPIQKFLSKRMGEPTDDWCRYAVIDPGYNVCAVTFWGVPPPDVWGDYRVCYDMMYLRNCTAKMFADGMRIKTQGRVFQSFIIDAHGARIRDMGGGVTPRQQYMQALEEANVESIETGHGFIDASDDIKGRVLTLHTWLSVRPNGTPLMYVVEQKCDKLVWEMGRFRKKVIGGVIQEEANRKGFCHAIETCEYAAAHGLEYIRPVKPVKQSSVAERIIEARKQRERQRRVSVFTQPTTANANILGPRGGS